MDSCPDMHASYFPIAFHSILFHSILLYTYYRLVLWHTSVLPIEMCIEMQMSSRVILVHLPFLPCGNNRTRVHWNLGEPRATCLSRLCPGPGNADVHVRRALIQGLLNVLNLSGQNSPSQWSGELSQPALTILHQHAIQGDVTVLQSYVVRWIAFARKLPDKMLHFSVLYHVLNDLDCHWTSDPLSREEVNIFRHSHLSYVYTCRRSNHATILPLALLCPIAIKYILYIIKYIFFKIFFTTV